MKKILIISYYYPPASFVGGNRVRSFATHLHKFGVYPIILTRNWNNNQTNTYEKMVNNSFSYEKYETHEVYRVSYKQTLRDKLFSYRNSLLLQFFRRGLTFLELVASNFSVKFSPCPELFYQAEKILAIDKKIDIVVISGRPFQNFLFGYLLKKKHNQIKWIADYRDEWNTYQGYKKEDFLSRTIRYFEQKSEKKWLSNAAFFISVSDYWVSNIEGFVDTKGYKVMNGYELFDLPAVREVASDDSFVISYNGTVYAEQDFSIIAAAIERLVTKYKDRINFLVQFIGTSNDMSVVKKVEKTFVLIKSYVKFTERLPFPQLLSSLKKSDILLLTRYSKVKGWYPVKMFDYYLVEKPILLCPSDNADMEKFINETNSGFVADSEEECFLILEKLLLLKLNKTPYLLNQNKKVGSFYSREHQAKVLADLL